MKLTEQQLSQLFKHKKTASIDLVVENLNDLSQASDARIAAVEKIADNSHLSASYHVINQLQGWSKSVATEITTTSTSQPVFEGFFAWFKPVMATAALASIVYIGYPQFESQQVSPLTTPEKGVFTANFEEAVDKQPSLLPTKTINNQENDIIYSEGFG